MSVTCSSGRLAIGEPLAGSAPHARLWILLEQDGPWGRDALLESHLPVEAGRALAALADGRPARVGLMRTVGAHVDSGRGTRHLLIARTDAGRSWLTVREVNDVHQLADLIDVDALLGATAPPSDLPGAPAPAPERALLVCTNAKRDQCCAVLGRPLAAELASDAGEHTQVWETSHTGGHRFAPTFVSLPDGYLYGGPDAATASLDACRGRSSLVPEAQVAELAVLKHIGANAPRPLDVTGADDEWRVSTDEQTYTVRVERRSGPDRSESCGKPAVSSSWLTTTVQSLHGV